MASPLRNFFRLAVALSWGAGLVGLLTGLEVGGLWYMLAGYGVSIAGLIMAARHREFPQLLKRLQPNAASIAWSFAIAVFYFAISGLQPLRITWTAAIHDPGPLGEEFGWRGFALPKLIAQYGAIRATLILAFFHALWHAPLFFIPSMPQRQLWFPAFVAGIAAMAVFDTFLYLRARSSLLLAIVVHFFANQFATAAGPGGFTRFALLQAAVAAVLILIGAPRPAHPNAIY